MGVSAELILLALEMGNQYMHLFHCSPARVVCLVVQVDVGIVFVPASVGTKLRMDVLGSAVKVLKLVSFRAGTFGNPYSGSALTTMSGGKGKYQAQLGLGATLSDKRQYPRLFANNGSPVIPGLVNFTSKLKNILQVDGKTGTLKLLGNHHSSIVVEAKTCSGVSGFLNLFCNLNPVAVGDADIGKSNGAPVDAAKVGDTFTIPVRVNTGGRALSFFRVNVKFDKDAFKVIKVQHTVGQGDGSVTFINVRAVLPLTHVFDAWCQFCVSSGYFPPSKSVPTYMSALLLSLMLCCHSPCK